MASQSGVAFQDFPFQPSQSTSTTYYPVASSSSYTSRDSSAFSQDLSLLSHQFGQQSIHHHDPRNASRPYNQPAASGPYSHPVQQSHATSSPHHAFLPHQPPVCSQRQTDARLQCQAGHILQPSSVVVEHGVATGQCSVCNAAAGAAPPQPTLIPEDEAIGDEFEDEGFQEPPSLARLTYRRSTDLFAGGQGYVSRSIRARKKRRSDPGRVQ
jgi:hypothetical protein